MQHSLNITKGSLAGWTVRDAVVELIANAQDEDKDFRVRHNDRTWIIENAGTLRLRNFVMDPNQNKRGDDRKHGGFGYGLKDAIAVLLYHDITFTAQSDAGEFTIVEVPVDEVRTLHVRQEQASQHSNRTTVTLTGHGLPNPYDCILQTKGLELEFNTTNAAVYTRETGREGWIYVYMRGLYPASERLKNGERHDVIVNFEVVPKSLQDRLGRDRKNRSVSHFNQLLVDLFVEHDMLGLLPARFQPQEPKPQPVYFRPQQQTPTEIATTQALKATDQALKATAQTLKTTDQALKATESLRKDAESEAALAKELWLSCATSHLPSRGNFDEDSIELWIQSKEVDHKRVVVKLKGLFKDFDCFVQGSVLTGTQLTDSDIDLVVYCPQNKKQQLQELLGSLNQVDEPKPMPNEFGPNTKLHNLKFDNVPVDVLVFESAEHYKPCKNSSDSYAPKTDTQKLGLLFFKRWRMAFYGFQSSLPKSRVFQCVIHRVDPQAKMESFEGLVLDSLKTLADTEATKQALVDDFGRHHKREWEMVRAAADATLEHFGAK